MRSNVTAVSRESIMKSCGNCRLTPFIWWLPPEYMSCEKPSEARIRSASVTLRNSLLPLIHSLVTSCLTLIPSLFLRSCLPSVAYGYGTSEASKEETTEGIWWDKTLSRLSHSTYQELTWKELYHYKGRFIQGLRTHDFIYFKVPFMITAFVITLSMKL